MTFQGSVLTAGGRSPSNRGTAQPNLRKPGRAQATRFATLPDIAVGVVFGLLAGANLVQGAWSTAIPWLDLTSAAFVLAVPITLVGLRGRSSLAAAAVILLLAIALTLGYLAPALTADAEQKRVNLVVGVAFVFLGSYLSLKNPRRLKAFFSTLVCLSIAVLIGQFATPDPLFLATGRRAPDGLNPIAAGRALGAALVLVVASLTYSRQGRRRLFLMILALLLAAGLLLAGSRGPVIGALAAIVVMLLTHPSLRRLSKVAAVTALCLGGALVLAHSTITSSRLVELSASGRDTLYANALQAALDHPLGIGWGNFSRYVPALSNNYQGDKLYAHNIILEFWIEAGLVAAAIFCLVALLILYRALRSAATSPEAFALAALLVDLLVGAMLSSDVIGNRMLWVVLAVALGGGALRADAAASQPLSQTLRQLTRARSR